MTRINPDYSASLYAKNYPLNAKSGSGFSDALASSADKTQITVSAISPSAGIQADFKTDFASILNDALKDYGIDVPPALRVTSGANGLELAGDRRNEQFQSMLKDHVGLATNFTALLGQAKAGRDAALSGVMSAFAGDNPSATVSDFLDGFEESEKNTTYSVRFNGADFSTEEKGDHDWQPVKDGKDFMADILAAYTAYLAKTQVISISDKKDDKDDGVDDALRKQLRDAKQNDMVIS